MSYLNARQSGSTPDDATAAAARYMDDVHHIPAELPETSVCEPVRASQTDPGSRCRFSSLPPAVANLVLVRPTKARRSCLILKFEKEKHHDCKGRTPSRPTATRLVSYPLAMIKYCKRWLVALSLAAAELEFVRLRRSILYSPLNSPISSLLGGTSSTYPE